MSVKVITIGRSEDNDIVLNNSSVSRKHAEIFVNDEEGLIILTDLGSTNGTYVNGKRITDSVILKRKDIVKVGDAPPIPWRNYILEPQEEVIIKNEPGDEPIGGKETIKGSSDSKAVYYVLGSIIILILCLFIIYVFDASTEANDTKKDVETEETVQDPIKTGAEDEETVFKEGEIKIKDQPISSGQKISYNYDCMDNTLLTDASDMENEFVDAMDVQVSISEERDVGKQLHEGVKEEYRFINDHRTDKIKSIKSKLTQQIENPRGFNYSIYLIESDEINAFTAGGYIYVTSKMYSYAKSDDELACIIGHEIAHNECGHITYQLKKQKANSMLFGDFFGSAADNLSYFLTSGFNQKRETESDFHGIDYATRAGYNSCAVSQLWERMSQEEGPQNELDNMMRSHPYSEKRSTCCREHILNNYNYNCPN